MVSSVTPTATYEGWNGDIKTIVLELSDTPGTGDQYDTNLDTAATAKFRQILGVSYSATPSTSAAPGSLAGDPTPPFWDAATGIVSLGRVTPLAPTGFLTVWGK